MTTTRTRASTGATAGGNGSTLHALQQQQGRMEIDAKGQNNHSRKSSSGAPTTARSLAQGSTHSPLLGISREAASAGAGGSANQSNTAPTETMSGAANDDEHGRLKDLEFGLQNISEKPTKKTGVIKKKFVGLSGQSPRNVTSSPPPPSTAVPKASIIPPQPLHAPPPPPLEQVPQQQELPVLVLSPPESATPLKRTRSKSFSGTPSRRSYIDISDQKLAGEKQLQQQQQQRHYRTSSSPSPSSSTSQIPVPRGRSRDPTSVRPRPLSASYSQSPSASPARVAEAAERYRSRSQSNDRLNSAYAAASVTNIPPVPAIPASQQQFRTASPPAARSPARSPVPVYSTDGSQYLPKSKLPQQQSSSTEDSEQGSDQGTREEASGSSSTPPPLPSVSAHPEQKQKSKMRRISNFFLNRKDSGSRTSNTLDADNSDKGLAKMRFAAGSKSTSHLPTIPSSDRVESERPPLPAFAKAAGERPSTRDGFSQPIPRPGTREGLKDLDNAATKSELDLIPPTPKQVPISPLPGMPGKRTHASNTRSVSSQAAFTSTERDAVLFAPPAAPYVASTSSGSSTPLTRPSTPQSASTDPTPPPVQTTGAVPPPAKLHKLRTQNLGSSRLSVLITPTRRLKKSRTFDDGEVRPKQVPLDCWRLDNMGEAEDYDLAPLVASISGESSATAAENSPPLPDLWNPTGDVLVYLCAPGDLLSPGLRPAFRISSNPLLFATLQSFLVDTGNGSRSPQSGIEGIAEEPSDDAADGNNNVQNELFFDIPTSKEPAPKSLTDEEIPARYALYYTRIDPSRRDQVAILDVRNLFAFLDHKCLVACAERINAFQILERLYLQLFIEPSVTSAIQGTPPTTPGSGNGRPGLYLPTIDELPTKIMLAETHLEYYINELRLDDVRPMRKSTDGPRSGDGRLRDSVEAMYLGEKWRSARLFLEGYLHTAGRWETVKDQKHPLLDYLAPATLSKLDLAAIDLENRRAALANRFTGLSGDFAYPAIFAGVGKYPVWKPAKSAFAETRKLLIAHLKWVYGSWAPKAGKRGKGGGRGGETGGLNREVIRRVERDVGRLWELLVDWEAPRDVHEFVADVDNSNSGSGDERTNDLRALLEEFDRASPPIQPRPIFDMPRLPAPPPTTPNSSNKKASKKIKTSEAATTLLHASWNKLETSPHGPDGDEGTASYLVEEFKRVEIASAQGHTIEEIQEQRRGRWIFIYAVMQSLPMLVVDAPIARWTDGCEYFLCIGWKGALLPWEERTSAGGVSGKKVIGSSNASVTPTTRNRDRRASVMWSAVPTGLLPASSSTNMASGSSTMHVTITQRTPSSVSHRVDAPASVLDDDDEVNAAYSRSWCWVKAAKHLAIEENKYRWQREEELKNTWIQEQEEAERQHYEAYSQHHNAQHTYFPAQSQSQEDVGEYSDAHNSNQGEVRRNSSRLDLFRRNSSHLDLSHPSNAEGAQFSADGSGYRSPSAGAEYRPFDPNAQYQYVPQQQQHYDLHDSLQSSNSYQNYDAQEQSASNLQSSQQPQRARSTSSPEENSSRSSMSSGELAMVAEGLEWKNQERRLGGGGQSSYDVNEIPEVLLPSTKQTRRMSGMY
ncbi:hypothetical protein DFH27DRAFT_560464 [Peziza echinospora]|nr:hypothetical protein DFH27DRAFT_560464 [Peziza echinospora]